MCNCAWLLLLHPTAVKLFDGLAQICTQKYNTSCQWGVGWICTPLTSLKSATAWIHSTSILQTLYQSFNASNFHASMIILSYKTNPEQGNHDKVLPVRCLVSQPYLYFSVGGAPKIKQIQLTRKTTVHFGTVVD